MYKKILLGGLLTAFLGLNTAAHADCPDAQIKCANGIMGTTVNTKWSWWSWSCEPCLSGCGRGMNNWVIPYCASVNSSITKDQMDVGIGLGSVTKQAADAVTKAAPAIGAIAKAAG